MDKTNEIELWNQCLKGNTHAFEEIYKRFYPMLYSYGIKIIADNDLVRDAIQSLFVKLIQNHQKLSHTEYLKGYLICSFRNKLFDLLEQQKKMDDIAHYEEAFSVENLFTTLFNKEDETNRQEKKLMLAFQQLSGRQQKILYLYYVNDLKHEEIAKVLNINYQSSKNLLFRSLTKLRELFFLATASER